MECLHTNFMQNSVNWFLRLLSSSKTPRQEGLKSILRPPQNTTATPPSVRIHTRVSEVLLSRPGRAFYSAKGPPSATPDQRRGPRDPHGVRSSTSRGRSSTRGSQSPCGDPRTRTEIGRGSSRTPCAPGTCRPASTYGRWPAPWCPRWLRATRSTRTPRWHSSDPSVERASAALPVSP